MEKLISEILGFLITILIMVLLILFGELWYHVNQYDDFKNQCIQVVQRSGGMTKTAQQRLGELDTNTGTGANKNSISGRYYHGHFWVTPKGSTNVQYGSPAKFTIHSSIPLTTNTTSDNFFGIKGQKAKGGRMTWANPVSTTSEVRQDSQGNISDNTGN